VGLVLFGVEENENVLSKTETTENEDAEIEVM